MVINYNDYPAMKLDNGKWSDKYDEFLCFAAVGMERSNV